jgi:uncharacterized membrane protein YcaP (DUF421 family)
MDPLRIVIRVVFAYLTLLALVRGSGKRTVKQGSPFDFAVALILGDMFDDAVWAEVPLSQFAVGCGMLVVTHLILDLARYRFGRSA